MKDLLLKEVLEDEKKYCFDRSFCNDENWDKLNYGVTRKETFELMNSHYKKLTAEQILEETGDKYRFVVDNYNKQRIGVV